MLRISEVAKSRICSLTSKIAACVLLFGLCKDMYMFKHFDFYSPTIVMALKDNNMVRGNELGDNKIEETKGAVDHV